LKLILKYEPEINVNDKKGINKFIKQQLLLCHFLVAQGWDLAEGQTANESYNE
jgi:hypothetical protein